MDINRTCDSLFHKKIKFQAIHIPYPFGIPSSSSQLPLLLFLLLKFYLFLWWGRDIGREREKESPEGSCSVLSLTQGSIS